MSMIAQLLGIEKGNPLGVFVLLTMTLVGLGWLIYSYPAGQAAKELVKLRKEFLDWKSADDRRFEALWEQKLEVMKRCEDLEGQLARLKAQHGIAEDWPLPIRPVAEVRRRDEI